MSSTSSLTGLPHWETIPADIPAATEEIKAAIRAQIAASGRTVEEVVAEIEDYLEGEIADIQAAKDRGEEVWPVIDYADIEAGRISEDFLRQLKRRGCVGRPRALRPRPGRAVGPRRRRLRGVEQVLRELRRTRRRLLRHPRGRDEQARDLSGLLVERPDGGAPASADGEGAGIPELPVDLRERRTPVVRSGSGQPLSGPDPASAARCRLRRTGHPSGSRHAGSVDDRGLPAALPPPVLR